MLMHSNEHHLKKRSSQYQKNIPIDFKLLIPFEEEKFHFLKASGVEDIIEIWEKPPLDESKGKRSIIKVNISPVFRGHSVYLPHVDDKIP